MMIGGIIFSLRLQYLFYLGSQRETGRIALPLSSVYNDVNSTTTLSGSVPVLMHNTIYSLYIRAHEREKNRKRYNRHIRITQVMSRDVITLHKSRWITLRKKPDSFMRVTSYTRPMAYCITLIIMYSSFLIPDQRIFQRDGNAIM